MTGNPLLEIIQSGSSIRDRDFFSACRGLSEEDLVKCCNGLEEFRTCSTNLYEKVRATLFLYAAYRFVLQEGKRYPAVGMIPFEGHVDMLGRRFESAIACFRKHLDTPHGSLFSALAEVYHHLTFDTLYQQVKQSVRTSRGNQWIFRVGHYLDHPLRISAKLREREAENTLFPILEERVAVRLDLSHSGWSDIFFLGMDYPEGARVINISVDLGVCGRDTSVRPPICARVRVIDEPLLRISSLDLNSVKEIRELDELFNFGNDYLSLLKAGIIASGLVPPSFEGTDQPLEKILAQVIGNGMGLELVTQVNGIPKGSRLAVSTSLLAAIISALMRATGQTSSIEGGLSESERRLIASRAILGEWLGGSGGGWQDSGGIWPGIKAIEGSEAKKGDPEHGVSKGALLPMHKLMSEPYIHPDIANRLSKSLVLLHGGMAQDVGPILEMVTEKYLLRSEREWRARQEAGSIYDAIRESLQQGDIKKLGELTMRNWEGPLKDIIPWVTNQFTEAIIAGAQRAFGTDFWGFLMLGGMSGGGMAMFCAPERRDEFQNTILDIMGTEKGKLESSLAFAINPLVYDFKINTNGAFASILRGEEALMPEDYYQLQLPELVKEQSRRAAALRKAEFDFFTSRKKAPETSPALLRTMVGHLFQVAQPAVRSEKRAWDMESEELKSRHGFDIVQHEQIRRDLLKGRIGLAFNRLPADTRVQDVSERDVAVFQGGSTPDKLGNKYLRNGKVAALTLAAGTGSRWTKGSGVIKALSPFVQMKGRHRCFLDVQLAKSRKTASAFGAAVPHIVATSFLTHGPIETYLRGQKGNQSLFLSPGTSIEQRLVPTKSNLKYLWEELPQEKLDEQKEKIRNMQHKALMTWAQEKGEGSDYVDNIPLQRFNPPGHWYEVPNLFKNGVLADVLKQYPQIETLLLHNIDTLGTNLDPGALDIHLQSGNSLTFEVVPRRINDSGGGLARVNGRVRLLEGLAQPNDEDEFKLRYYNSMTTWIQIDPLLKYFGLTREDLSGPKEEISEAVRQVARHMPTYATVKQVKYRWGHGQEDIYPVMQFEKLWSDMSSLTDLPCGYLAVPRFRGQQLKEVGELDAWANDGSREYVEALCEF